MAASEELVTINAPDSAAAEAFRTLRTNIILRDFDNKIKIINVISANAQESKTTTVLNLACVYAQLGKKVIVIDMDLRLPSVHKKLGIKNKQGITDVVGRQTTFSESVVHYAQNLDVITAGTKIPFSSEFVQSSVLQSFLNSLKNHYDLVLIDCPPINIVTDGLITSTYCDGTIFCVASNNDEKRELERAKDQLEQMSINVLGVVMSKLPVSKKATNYEYGYHQTTNEKKTPQTKENK